MTKGQIEQLLLAIGGVDVAIDVLNGMYPSWHTEENDQHEVTVVKQYLQTSREILKLLTITEN